MKKILSTLVAVLVSGNLLGGIHLQFTFQGIPSLCQMPELNTTYTVHEEEAADKSRLKIEGVLNSQDDTSGMVTFTLNITTPDGKELQTVWNSIVIPFEGEKEYSIGYSDPWLVLQATPL